MKFRLPVFACLLLFLSACIPLRESEPQLAYRLDQISLINETLQMSIYLERPDMFLAQPDSELDLDISELHDSLQPKSLSIFSPDSGKEYQCDTLSFPHNCEIVFDKLDFEDKTKFEPIHNYILRASFKDGNVSETDLVMPYLFYLDKPLILEPAMETEDKTILKFKEVGAEKYEVNLLLCYESDKALKSCVDGDKYLIQKQGELLVLEDNDDYFSAEMTVLNEVITLNFDFNTTGYDYLKYEVSAQLYGQKYRGADVSMASSDELIVDFFE